MFKKTLALAVLTASVGSYAQTADSGFYLLTDLGYGKARDVASKSDVDAMLVGGFADFGIAVFDGRSSLDDSDFTFSVGAGYQFNRYFALELAYVDLGEFEYKARGTISDGVATEHTKISLSHEVQAISLSAIGSYPFSDSLSGYVKGGVMVSDMDLKAKVSLPGLGVSESFKDDETDEDFHLGLGMQYDVNELWAITAEYSRIFDLGTRDLGESDYDRFSIGFKYRL
ncbi:outer membrane beta-barrel protein [Parahaliea sp. F7430]|uniref:Outer membrane beta-barrel protein n=1 Tax=Sediminihaliea albiluteola TaxID=2758564 RepID=A0A7W2TUC9_9GAMM|nr:outer membrane beta-barrel protein [Sediminihaliea albiluteola]MBA6412137.1 outer membrane beta-barrel protein [Sediminihaliea albiluteola]